MNGIEIIRNKNGVRYTKDKKFIKKADIPQDTLNKLYTDYAAAHAKPKVCIFDGAFGKFTRMINGQTIYICEADYYDTTVGKTVQKLREVGQEMLEGKDGVQDQAKDQEKVTES